jgi:alkanesulfonate monooxygenase SsuD/methylene tetrahydromethanopterin reductase-like flavin-dependent oxidoreductase (luciferase family)
MSQGSTILSHAPEVSAVGRETLRFGVILYPDADLPDLARQAQWLEKLGFDEVYLPDHSADLRQLDGPWFDGWSALPLMATATTRIRIGTLVSNPILRPPATLARQAMTLDALSGGRLDLGIGAGLFDWDHHAVGEEPWPPKERAERLADYVAIVDGILRGSGEPFSYEGRRLWVRDVRTAPASIERPRPTLVVGGQSPTVLRVAAERGDVWNTIGPFNATADEVVAATARQNARIDELAKEAGRDPKEIRRSYTTFGPFELWTGGATLPEAVERFAAIGMTEFVLGLPPRERWNEVERLAADLPALRAA